jgi:hypothetical protein
MRHRFLAPVAALALAGAALPAVARTPATPVHVVTGDLGAATGMPQRWALAALRAQESRLGVDASAYRVELVRTSLIGTHVRGRQYRGGVPVEGTDFLVSAIEDRVAQVDAFGSRLPGGPAAHPVGEVVARSAALTAAGATTLIAPLHVQRLLVARAGRLVDTYRVSVLAQNGPARVDVDAATGRVLALTDPARYDDGSALVFDPNPIQSTRNGALREPGVDESGIDTDLDSAALTAARVKLPLKGLDATSLQLGLLSGPWVSIQGMAGYLLGPVFDITRGDPRFEGLMAYAHVDRFQRYLRSLGLTNVNAESQDIVTTRLETYDNSMYMPAEDVIVFGAGGVDDAEDAEVILHEYGHAVQDAQVPGWGANNEGGAMGEAFGDFQAANYYARTSKGFRADLCVADWDATSYSTAKTPCLRRLDSKKKWPKDKKDEVHADGEIWSAYLWRVRSHLPGNAAQKSDAAFRLVLSSHELLTPEARFANAVNALRTAAKALHHPEWKAFIDSEARKSGFDLNP